MNPIVQDRRERPDGHGDGPERGPRRPQHPRQTDYGCCDDAYDRGGETAILTDHDDNVVEGSWIGLAPDGVTAKGTPVGISIDASGGKIGFSDCLRTVLAEGGDVTVKWPTMKLLDRCDALLSKPVSAHQLLAAIPREFFDAVREERGSSGRSFSPQTRDMNPIYTGKDVSYIDTKQANRDKAANHAYNKFRDMPYDTNFYDNKDNSNGKLNCSELVWKMYRDALGIELRGQAAQVGWDEAEQQIALSDGGRPQRSTATPVCCKYSNSARVPAGKSVAAPARWIAAIAVLSMNSSADGSSDSWSR